jgi:hypothetical protein
MCRSNVEESRRTSISRESRGQPRKVAPRVRSDREAPSGAPAREPVCGPAGRREADKGRRPSQDAVIFRTRSARKTASGPREVAKAVGGRGQAPSAIAHQQLFLLDDDEDRLDEATCDRALVADDRAEAAADRGLNALRGASVTLGTIQRMRQISVAPAQG